MKQDTLAALRESISDSRKLKKVIRDNMQQETTLEIRLNLIYLIFDFSSRKVLLRYYALDDDYPEIEMSFNELGAFVED